MYVAVAVATKAEGFRTLAQLVPAFAFHIITAVAGSQMLLAAVRKADAEKSPEPVGAISPEA